MPHIWVLHLWLNRTYLFDCFQYLFIWNAMQGQIFQSNLHRLALLWYAFRVQSDQLPYNHNTFLNQLFSVSLCPHVNVPPSMHWLNHIKTRATYSLSHRGCNLKNGYAHWAHCLDSMIGQKMGWTCAWCWITLSPKPWSAQGLLECSTKFAHTEEPTPAPLAHPVTTCDYEGDVFELSAVSTSTHSVPSLSMTASKSISWS